MAHALQRAETDIALDVKSVLQNELRLADLKFGAFEKRLDQRFDGFEARMEARMAAFEERMDERFAAFEKRMDERFTAFEARWEESLDRKIAEAKWESLRWNVGLWLAQLVAVAGIVKMIR